MVFGENQSLAIAALTGAGVLKALLSRSAPSSPSSGPAELKFSHMGIFATNPEALGSFYEEVLGFTRTDKGEMPGPGGKLMELVFLSRDPEEHHQIVMVSGRPADLAFNVVNQISLSTTSLGEVKQMYALLKERQDITELLTVTHGNGAALPPDPPTHACRHPHKPYGCAGAAISLYFKDPEGNRVEIFVNSPYYCIQPMRSPIDLEQSDEQVTHPTHPPQSPRKRTRYTPSRGHSNPRALGSLVAECAQRSDLGVCGGARPEAEEVPATGGLAPGDEGQDGRDGRQAAARIPEQMILLACTM